MRMYFYIRCCSEFNAGVASTMEHQRAAQKLGFSKWTYCSWMWLTSSWNCCEHHSNQSVFPRIGSWRSKVWRFCRVLSWMLMTSSWNPMCLDFQKLCRFRVALNGCGARSKLWKKLGAAWTFRGLDSWQQWRIPTFWHPQAMYTGIFNLCRMSATSGTKSCCLKSGNLSRQLFDANGFPKPKKNGVRHGHLEDYLLKWQQEINSLPATVNVQGKFPFVPDVADIRHKILLHEVWIKLSRQLFDENGVPKLQKKWGAAWTSRGLNFKL